MKVTVCIGSSCHIKGSRPVVEKLQELIAQDVTPGTVSSFFEKEMKARV